MSPARFHCATLHVTRNGSPILIKKKKNRPAGIRARILLIGSQMSYHSTTGPLNEKCYENKKSHWFCQTYFIKKEQKRSQKMYNTELKSILMTSSTLSLQC